MNAPDIFTNVHKGIRKALFEACMALGRATDDESGPAARATLGSALHFIAHHGDNEDSLLLPLLAVSAPAAHARMLAGHERVNAALAHLREVTDLCPLHELYLQACDFAALYIEHMREEETTLEPTIRAALTRAELVDFGRAAVARTSPDDQRAMLGHMLPAMTRPEAQALLDALPPALSASLAKLL